MPGSPASWGAALALVALAANDPRIELVNLQLERRHEAALERVEQHLAEDPETAHRLGLDYLRGHLLLLLDRRQEAVQAFATTMAVTPALAAYSRYRLAVEQERLGHPEVAAGLVATLLGSSPPRSLVGPGIRLLRRTLEQGGDCRLLGGLLGERFGAGAGREIGLVRAECEARRGHADAAVTLLLRLLEEDPGDEVARLAAGQLEALQPEPDTRALFLVGLSFHQHREFESAIPRLSRTLARAPLSPPLSRSDLFDCRYALARSHFWQGRYEEAARAFAALAAEAPNAERRAQAFYQEGRSHELAGSWDRAVALFQRAHDTDPRGRWADAALFSYLRLQWRRGNEEAAEKAYEALAALRSYATQSRAALFLASSDLVVGRTDRAPAWLTTTARLGRVDPQELHYWEGRLEEAAGRPGRAVERYVRVVRQDPYHPFARAAARRLRGEPLRATAVDTAAQLAASNRSEDLYSAWLLLGDADPRGQRARQRLGERLAADAATRPFLELEQLPPPRWPLWTGSLREPEEMLLALGIFEEASAAVLRHFPVRDPDLAFTGSLLLSQAGDTKRSLYVAEVLANRIPGRLPAELLPLRYRRLLYPMRYSYLILRQAAERGIDPFLLAAIIREESRFDPAAFSTASARGLTQFVYPTAERIARQFDVGIDGPEDLARPEVSIALGAAYLAELSADFRGSAEQTVAAYNAGEPQAALWRRYCVSDEPEEYHTKVAFRETRSYLRKVLSSRAHYADLYPAPPARGSD